MVFLGHFMLTFPELENWKAIPLLKIFVNGLFPVHTFILLAGFSLCCSLEGHDLQTSISKVVAKRYLRFIVPIFLPTLVAFFACNYGFGFNQQWAQFTGSEWLVTLLPPSANLKDLVRGLIFAPVEITSIINPLWMLKYIFWGTFLALPFYVGTRTLNNRVFKYGLLILYMYLMLRISIFMSTMLAGILLFYLHKEGIRAWWLSIACMLCFIVLNFVEIQYVNFLRSIIWICIFIFQPTIQKALSNKVCLWLGGVSFEVYIIHSIVISCLSCYMALQISYKTLIVSYSILIITFAIVLLFAWWLNKVDKYLDKVVMVVLNKFIK